MLRRQPLFAAASLGISAMLDLSGSDGIVDSVDAAEHAGLTYASDDSSGIKRIKAGKGFWYKAGAKET